MHGEKVTMAKPIGSAIKRVLPPYEARSALRALRVYEQDWLGAAELALVCGVSKQTLSNWRTRGYVPEPHQQLAMGPVWAKEAIRAWLLRVSML